MSNLEKRYEQLTPDEWEKREHDAFLRGLVIDIERGNTAHVIETLINVLSDDKASNRLMAVRIIRNICTGKVALDVVQPSVPRTRKEIEANLHHTQTTVHDLAQGRVFDSLAAVLDDKDIEVICAAAYALNEISPTRTLPLMFSLLNDENPKTCKAALHILYANTFPDDDGGDFYNYLSPEDLMPAFNIFVRLSKDESSPCWLGATNILLALSRHGISKPYR